MYLCQDIKTTAKLKIFIEFDKTAELSADIWNFLEVVSHNTKFNLLNSVIKKLSIKSGN